MAPPSVLSLLSLFLLLGSVTADGGDRNDNKIKYPNAPELTFLYTVNITGGASYFIGEVPRGKRNVVAIVGGAFAGPKLKGTVAPVGGDWSLRDNNGTITADVRQTFKTDDGAYIQVFETGTTQSDGTAYVRLTFETGNEKYYWLSYIVAIGIIRLVGPGQLTIDTWQVCCPLA
ncbi:hypothetical protein QBC35DRAFT_546357 [Podospora australis]|uniref:Uncharacterized protein n=1 Tax=Podospora australis TaxID=1536484 RepID=A0AAN6WLS6_9PEZI|nr:hypothetical protein QBC35DRAFT_546357 [Podospora australis]